MHATRHAQIRSQQRGIDLDKALFVLNECGTRTYNNNGSLIRFLDKRACRKIEKLWGQKKAQEFLEKHRDIYCVESIGNDRVITIGFRHKRIQKKGHGLRRRRQAQRETQPS